MEDLINRDMKKLFPSVAHLAKVRVPLNQLIVSVTKPRLQIVIVDAQDHVLSTFDVDISKYTEGHLRKLGATILTNAAVTGVTEKHVEVSVGGKVEAIPCGMCIWATGIKQRPVIESFRRDIGAVQSSTKGLLVDDSLRVLGADGIWAIGDCATIHQPRLLSKTAELFAQLSALQNGQVSVAEVILLLRRHTKTYPQLKLVARELEDNAAQSDLLDSAGFKLLLERADSQLRALAATAQVANQQGRYVAESLNQTIGNAEDASVAPFKYRHIAAMAYVGQEKAVADFSSNAGFMRFLRLTGLSAFFLWRSVYFSQLFSTERRLTLAMDWTRSMVGRLVVLPLSRC